MPLYVCLHAVLRRHPQHRPGKMKDWWPPLPSDSLFKLIAFVAPWPLAIYGILAALLYERVVAGGWGPSECFRTTPAMMALGARYSWFFGSVIVMPHMFHIRHLKRICLPKPCTRPVGAPPVPVPDEHACPPSSLGRNQIQRPTIPDFYTLGIALAANSPACSTGLPPGALSAATGLIMVTTKALASILLNHLVLLVYRLNAKTTFTAGSAGSKSAWLRHSFARIIDHIETDQYLPISMLGCSPSLRESICCPRYWGALLASGQPPRCPFPAWGRLGTWLFTMLLPSMATLI